MEYAAVPEMPTMEEAELSSYATLSSPEETRAFLIEALAATIVGVQVMWTTGAKTRDVAPSHMALSHCSTGTAVLTLCDTLDEGVQTLLCKLMASPTVIKVVWDGRILTDCFKTRFLSGIKNVLDFPLVLVATQAHVDPHPGRLRRGVIRLPDPGDYLPPMYTTDVCDYLVSCARSLRQMGQMFVGVDGYGDVISLSECFGQTLLSIPTRTYTTETSPFLPLGVLTPSDVDPKGTKCTMCCRLFSTASFPDPNIVQCRVCLESSLPCSVFKRDGRCSQRNCPYRHERLPCGYGALCVDHHVLAICPYHHPNEPQPTITATTEDSADISVEEPSMDSEDITPHISYPPLYPKVGYPVPCRDFLGSGSCCKGEMCPYSHVPVPVFIPVPIPTACKQKQIKNFTPCAKYATKGKCKGGENCSFLHIPPEFVQNRPVPWGMLPLSY